MLTVAFLIAGIVSFLTVAVVALYRLVLQRRRLPDMPKGEQALALINAVLAMAFFSLGIWRALEGASGNDIQIPTPIAALTVEVPPGPTVIIVPVPGGDADGEATPAPEPRPTVSDQQATATAVRPVVSIESADDGDAVGATARVDGTSRGVETGQAPDSEPPWLYLLVRREAEAGEIDWWVQRHPVVQGDGRWNGFLSQGLSDLDAGTPFEICAIVSEASLQIGRRDEEPRAVARDCVSVELA